MSSASALVMAVLLGVTPPAGAAVKTHKKPAAVKLNPAARRLMSEGLGSLQSGDFAAAIASFNAAAREQPSAPAYFLLGWAHYQRGFRAGSVETADRDDAQAAIDAYALAVGLDPKLSGLTDPSRLYFSLALCDEAVESYGRALDAYNAALKAAPGKALIPLNAARLRLKMKDEDKALSNLRLAMATARKAGQQAALVAAVKNDPAFAPLMADSAMLRTIGDVRAAEELRDAVRDAPARPAPAAMSTAVLDQVAQGNLEFNFRRYNAAIADYNAALAADRKVKSLSAEQGGALLEKIGACYNKLGAADRAILFLTSSLSKDAPSAGSRYQLALAYAMSGKTAKALDALKVSLASASDPSELRRLAMLAKTDSELSAVRDLPGFRQAMGGVKLALR